MGKGYRNKIRAVDFYCTDKDRKTAYQERNTPQGGYNQPIKPNDLEKLPRSFRKLEFLTDNGKGDPKRKRSAGDKKSSTSKREKKQNTSQGDKEAKSDKKEQGETHTAKPPAIHEFKTKLRPGEKFWTFEQRLRSEQQQALSSQALAQPLVPIKPKRKEALKRRKDRQKVKQQEKEARIAEEEKLEFRGAEKIPFGEVVERPPLLKNLPKAPTPQPGIAALAEFLRKKQAAGEDPDVAVKAAEALQRHKLVQARTQEILKERSQQAYKDAKRRKVVTNDSAPDKQKKGLKNATPD